MILRCLNWYLLDYFMAKLKWGIKVYIFCGGKTRTFNNSVGRDVIPCDFFAKIDFFTLFDWYGCSLHENHGVQIFQAPEPNFVSNFQKLSLEPIDQQRVTQQNIDLIIFIDSTVNFRRVKGAVSTLNTFISMKILENLFWGSSSHIRAHSLTIYQVCLILLSNIFLFQCFCENLSTHMVEMPFSNLCYYCETQDSLFGLQCYPKTHTAHLI